MARHQITFLDQGTIPESIRWPDPEFPHTWSGWENTAPVDRIARLQDATIAVVNKVVLDREVLADCPHLKLVQVAATGVNNVDRDACRDLGIHVCNVQGYAGNAVPEWIVAQLLGLAWQQTHYRRVQDRGDWADAEHFALRSASVREIRTMRIGILGRGTIGQGTADRLRGFGSDVRFLERPGAEKARPGYADFDAELGHLDALILCCPLTEDNTEMVNADLLGRMKPGALLLNPSRGGLVNEQDLFNALRSGHLGGAALDVVSQEPIRRDNPLFAIREEANLVITPHIAWSSEEAITTLMEMAIDNMNRFVQGQRDHCLV